MVQRVKCRAWIPSAIRNPSRTGRHFPWPLFFGITHEQEPTLPVMRSENPTANMKTGLARSIRAKTPTLGLATLDLD